ncbi:hypothetical protein D3C87_1602820 [compost metagenome]
MAITKTSSGRGRALSRARGRMNFGSRISASPTRLIQWPRCAAGETKWSYQFVSKTCGSARTAPRALVIAMTVRNQKTAHGQRMWRGT